MAGTDKEIGQKGPDMEAFSAQKIAPSHISFNPVVFHADPETQSRWQTYNRVEDKV